jgi:hypothetical protein
LADWPCAEGILPHQALDHLENSNARGGSARDLFSNIGLLAT